MNSAAFLAGTIDAALMLMPKVCLLLIAALGAWPSSASAQPWADAYRAGDYSKAADLLHRMVVEQSSVPTFDPAPARQLATMYAEGLGVARDPIAACALARWVDMATNMTPGPEHPLAYQARLDESHQFMSTHCDGLSKSDSLAAARSLGCFGFGMPEAVLTLGERSVWVGRGGIRLTETADDRFAPDLGCPQVVARLRPVTMTPPVDAAPDVKPRYFVEMLAWLVSPGTDRSPAMKYVLRWQMYEICAARIDLVAMEELYSTSTWPGIALPAEFDGRFTTEMIRSGHVRWRMEGAPPKRGWIMLQETQAR